ncbi:uncharacterized protein LTR77_006991 [Saxophila tyrrhenica]|uniref:F-box domain-containing protein n=1 Tax=Saxophila tyrrhenica TaxID=1690608 RepID=A0AAV9PAL1_9PEZI|nr:hypothetical protein LTR77_006991 [Saxophila tyrrhenica]
MASHHNHRRGPDPTSPRRRFTISLTPPPTPTTTTRRSLAAPPITPSPIPSHHPPPQTSRPPPPANPFNNLPLETTQAIATFIETDSDLCAFRATCRSTLDAVEADGASFWRRRWAGCFERPASDVSSSGGGGSGSSFTRGSDSTSSSRWNGPAGNARFKEEYQKRRLVLKNGAEFMEGGGEREKVCLEVLRDLVADSFSTKTASNALTYESSNLAFLQRFAVANFSLLELFTPNLKRPYRSSTRRRSTTPPASTSKRLMQTIQVLLAPMHLNPDPMYEFSHYNFLDSQAAVYSTATVHPIFGGCYGVEIDMEYVLHNLNFWKYHMLRQAEGTLNEPYCDLDEDERPRWWDHALSQDTTQKLWKNWKGSYAFVERDEIDTLRGGRDYNQQIQDIFAGEDGSDGAFQSLTLELAPDDGEFVWPMLFEQHLKSLVPPEGRARTRAQRRSAKPDEAAQMRTRGFHVQDRHFEGEGKDVSEKFLASGWLNALPVQEGVPGWQRLTMMKYFEDENGNVDMQGLWAYEGVVLPGGGIIVGRWWSPSDEAEEDVYSGPFILWCVDGAKNAEVGEGEETNGDEEC